MDNNKMKLKDNIKAIKVIIIKDHKSHIISHNLVKVRDLWILFLIKNLQMLKKIKKEKRINQLKDNINK